MLSVVLIKLSQKGLRGASSGNISFKTSRALGGLIEDRIISQVIPEKETSISLNIMDLERARPDKAKRLTSGKGLFRMLRTKDSNHGGQNKSMYIHATLLPFPRAQAAAASNQWKRLLIYLDRILSLIRLWGCRVSCKGLGDVKIPLPRLQESPGSHNFTLALCY